MENGNNQQEKKETTFPADIERTCGLNPSTWKTVAGLFIVLGIAVSWVGATQFAQNTYSPNFNAPYFTTWFTTCWAVVIFPCYVLPRIVKGENFKSLFREGATVFGSTGFSLRGFLSLLGPFCFLWLLVNYGYIRALGEIHAADVTAIFSSNTAFVYIFSCVLLKEKLSVIRFFSVALSITGIVLFAYAEGFKGGSVVGIILTVSCAAGAALYNVCFKRRVGNATMCQVSMFLSGLGFFNIIVFWFVVIIMYFTKYEPIDWQDAPWGALCGTASLTLIFNFLLNFGVAFTFPLFISLGLVIGIPLNAVVDLVFKEKTFGKFKIVGALFIISGFLLMLVPLEYERKLLWEKVLKKKDFQETKKIETDV